MYDQDIIEKRPSSPISTSLLGISCLAFISAMVLQGMFLKSLTLEGSDSPTKAASTWSSKQAKTAKADFDKIHAIATAALGNAE